MVERWFGADFHLNHDYMVEKDKETGEPYRPFRSVEEMNETIIENFNRLVAKDDKVYLMGDVLFKPATSEHLLKRLNGRKRLIMGNHDEIREKTQYFTKHFKEICLWKKFKDEGFICTHVPLRTDGIRDTILNVHGHIHKAQLPEPCYMNVSIENTDYKPVHIDTIIARVQVLREMIANGEWVPPEPIAH